MEGIRGRAVTGELADERGIATTGMVLALEDDHASAFADDESVPILVEGTAGSLRVVVSCGEGSCIAESG